MLVPVGDFDGDGLRDLVAAISGETPLLQLRRGVDGTVLWSRPSPNTAPSIVSFALPEAGLLVWWRIDDESGWASGVGLTALRGDGSVAWSAERRGFTNWLPEHIAATHGRLVDVSVGNFVPGQAEDVMLTIRDYVNPATRVTVELLDGSTGVVAASHHDVGEGADATPVGDIDGSGHSDFVVASGGAAQSPAAVRAYSESGRPLWTAAIPSPGTPSVRPIADHNGDGTDDLVVLSTQLVSEDEVMRATALDGRTGAMLWLKKGDYVFGIGDVDGHPGGEVVLMSFVASPFAWAMRMEAVAFDGSPVWTRRHPFPIPSSHAGYGMGFWPNVGDVDRDGAFDHGWSTTVWRPDGSVELWDEVLSGRSGDALWQSDVRPAPLRASVDASGEDFAIARISPSEHRYTIVDGRALTPLWSRTYPRTAGGFVRLAGGPDLDGDGRAELVATLPDRTVEVLSGLDGSTLWSIS